MKFVIGESNQSCTMRLFDHEENVLISFSVELIRSSAMEISIMRFNNERSVKIFESSRCSLYLSVHFGRESRPIEKQNREEYSLLNDNEEINSRIIIGSHTSARRDHDSFQPSYFDPC